MSAEREINGGSMHADASRARAARSQVSSESSSSASRAGAKVIELADGAKAAAVAAFEVGVAAASAVVDASLVCAAPDAAPASPAALTAAAQPPTVSSRDVGDGCGTAGIEAGTCTEADAEADAKADPDADADADADAGAGADADAHFVSTSADVPSAHIRFASRLNPNAQLLFSPMLSGGHGRRRRSELGQEHGAWWKLTDSWREGRPPEDVREVLSRRGHANEAVPKSCSGKTVEGNDAEECCSLEQEGN
eukprot:4237953-Pleurochrysis_carterae.AAC.1